MSTWCDACVRKKKAMSAHGMTSGTEKGGTEVCEHVIIITRMLNVIARRSPGM